MTNLIRDLAIPTSAREACRLERTVRHPLAPSITQGSLLLPPHAELPSRFHYDVQQKSLSRSSLFFSPSLFRASLFSFSSESLSCCAAVNRPLFSAGLLAPPHTFCFLIHSSSCSPMQPCPPVVVPLLSHNVSRFFKPSVSASVPLSLARSCSRSGSSSTCNKLLRTGLREPRARAPPYLGRES